MQPPPPTKRLGCTGHRDVTHFTNSLRVCQPEARTSPPVAQVPSRRFPGHPPVWEDGILRVHCLAPGSEPLQEAARLPPEPLRVVSGRGGGSSVRGLGRASSEALRGDALSDGRASFVGGQKRPESGTAGAGRHTHGEHCCRDLRAGK